MTSVTSEPSELEFGTHVETKLSPLDALIGVIIRPLRTFERMREARRGHWWLVAVLAVIGTVTATLVTLPIQAEMVREQMEAQQAQFEDLPEEQRVQIEQQQAVFTSQSMLAGIGIAGGLLGIFVGYVVRAAVLFALGLPVGGRAGFGQVFRMAVWTTLPSVVRSFVAAIAVLATGQMPAPGLTAMFSASEAADMSMVLTALLSVLDIYTVWAIVLVTLGVAATYQLSKVKSLFIAIVFWLLGVALTVGLAAIGQMFAGMAPGA